MNPDAIECHGRAGVFGVEHVTNMSNVSEDAVLIWLDFDQAIPPQTYRLIVPMDDARYLLKELAQIFDDE